MVRKLAALAAFAAVLTAAPQLVTVQDVIYKADGSPFNGVLLIGWKSFEARDASFIGMHDLTVPVVNGVMRVQLAPTANAIPAAYYLVRYNSDGKIQFQEYWSVPASNTPVRLGEVRIASPLAGPVVAPEPVEGSIPQSDVAGLVDDLSARPVKGPGFAPSRAAAIAADGTIEAVAGNLEDCVRVDGTSGPCGSTEVPAVPGFVDGEMPSGAVDGANIRFMLARTPAPPESVAVYRNGVLQKQGLDYAVSGSFIDFETAATPQAGDILVASYRVADAAHPSGTAGGALTGEFPNPAIAPGAITDAHVSSSAAIRESKLALNYATHPAGNDPGAGEKAALAGSYGTPSATNRYVTDQDPRMTNARTPAGHPLLGSAHSDAAAGAPVRGDVMVAQGTAPSQWTRLAIGPAGRCLVSNGSDAVWNTCLYTGFTAGSVAFSDASGNLAQNPSRLVWDNVNRKLSIGNNAGAATLYVFDGQASTGSTELTVRAGQGQATDPLQRWLNASGAELGRMDADGRLQLPAFRAASTTARAAWQDAGAASDPTGVASGDAWFNASAQSHKAAHMGQAHPVPQVLCSSTGSSTTGATLARLGSCTVPANLLKAGDRVEIAFDYAHAGATSDFAMEVRWGGTTIASRIASMTETLVSGRGGVGIHSAGAQWAMQSWGTAATFAAGAGNAADSLTAALTIDFLGRMVSGGTDSVALRNFTVVRYPAQQNP